MMINILENILAKLTKAFYDNIKHIKIDLYTNSEKFINALNNIKYSLVFLDIEMPNIDGLQVAQYINNNKLSTKIVFISYHDKYEHNNSFLYKVIWFIKKDRFDADFMLALPTIKEVLGIDSTKYKFETEGEDMELNLDDIYYFETNTLKRNYICIHTEMQEYIIRKSLKDIENEISEHYKFFIRAHTGFLVNIKHILFVEFPDLKLDNNSIIPISRSNHHNIKENLRKYLKGLF